MKVLTRSVIGRPKLCAIVARLVNLRKQRGVAAHVSLPSSHSKQTTLFISASRMRTQEETYVSSFVENAISPGRCPVLFTGVVVVGANVITVGGCKCDDALLVSIERLSIVDRALQLVTAEDLKVVALADQCTDLRSMEDCHRRRCSSDKFSWHLDTSWQSIQ